MSHMKQTSNNLGTQWSPFISLVHKIYIIDWFGFSVLRCTNIGKHAFK